MDKGTLMTRIEWLFKKIVNRETITYAIAGIMTTIVNFASYEGFYRLGIPNLTANALAWVVAVSFAYIVNKVKQPFASSFAIMCHNLSQILCRQMPLVLQKTTHRTNVR